MTRSLGHRAPLLWLVLPMIGGLAAAHAGLELPRACSLGTALAGAGLSVVLNERNTAGWGVALALSMFCSGLASYALHRPRLPDWDRLPPREAKLSLQVERVFAGSNPRKTSGLASVIGAEGHLAALAGQRVYFSCSLRGKELAPLRSAVIAAIGRVEVLPRNPPMDSFDGFLFNSGVNFRFTRGRILREERPASAYQQFCARAEQRLSHLLGIGVAAKRPALVAVARAMMLGQQGELDDEQGLLFRHTGTMHIFSISGLHIAVIAGGLQALLSMLRLSRWAQYPIALATLWLYVDVTGSAPSAVRAFVMVACLQTAFVLRVPTNPVASLAASAFAVVLVTPLQLFSASFQMSYAIVAALLLLGLPLSECWQASWSPFRDVPSVTWRWWQRAVAAGWSGLSTALAIGLASSLAGALSGVLFFKLLTPGALLVNLVLIPLSSLVILAGFLSLLGGLCGLTAASFLFNHAAALLLWTIDWLVRLFLQLPAMWVEAQFTASWIGIVALSVLLAVFLAGYQLGWPRKYGGYWPPFLVVVATLALVVKF